MADEGTLATSAEVLLTIGNNASASQILEANTNIWVKWAEGEISMLLKEDVVANYANVSTNFKRYLSVVAASRAAMHAINEDQNSWQIATAQSKLNVLDTVWKAAQPILKDKDLRKLMGLT